MDMNSNEIKNFKKVLEDIVDVKIEKSGIPKYISAIVKSIDSKGNIDVILPPDTKTTITGLLNKTGEKLEIGDSVELCTKNGSVNNSWVSVKHKTNNAGGGGGDVEEAPIDGKPYARQDAGWVEIEDGAPVLLYENADTIQDQYVTVENIKDYDFIMFEVWNYPPTSTATFSVTKHIDELNTVTSLGQNMSVGGNMHFGVRKVVYNYTLQRFEFDMPANGFSTTGNNTFTIVNDNNWMVCRRIWGIKSGSGGGGGGEIPDGVVSSPDKSVEFIETVTFQEFETLQNTNSLVPNTIYNIPDSVNSITNIRYETGTANIDGYANPNIMLKKIQFEKTFNNPPGISLVLKTGNAGNELDNNVKVTYITNTEFQISLQSPSGVFSNGQSRTVYWTAIGY